MDNPCKAPRPVSKSRYVADINTASNRESSTYYNSVFMQLDQRWRLIVCAHSHQWILQRREGLHGGAWRGVKYFRSRKALLDACGWLGLLSNNRRSLIKGILPLQFNKEGAIRVTNDL